MIDPKLYPWLDSGFVVWTNLIFLVPAYVSIRHQQWFRVFAFTAIAGISTWYHIESDAQSGGPSTAADDLDHVMSVFLSMDLVLLLIRPPASHRKYEYAVETLLLLLAFSLNRWWWGNNPPTWYYVLPPVTVGLVVVGVKRFTDQVSTVHANVWLWTAITLFTAGIAFYYAAGEHTSQRKWWHGAWHITCALAAASWVHVTRNTPMDDYAPLKFQEINPRSPYAPSHSFV